MGRIGKLLSFIFTTRNGAKVADVKLDLGGGAVVQAEHFAPPGDDSQPLPGDYVVTVPTVRTGGVAAVGYVDPKNDQLAQAGERRIYARDSSGAVVGWLWLKADGSTVLSNLLGGVSIAVDGTVTINGVTISPTGEIAVPASLTIGGQEMALHYHTQGPDSASDTQVPTSTPTGP